MKAATKKLLMGSGVLTVLILPGQTLAGQKSTLPLSAGALEFGPGNVLFVGDTKGAAVHAFQLRDKDITSQESVSYGSAKSFQGRDLIEHVDHKVAAFLGASAADISINDMKVHGPSKQIFLSVHRGLGPDATPVILKVNDGQLEALELAELAHSQAKLKNLPNSETLEFGQPQRNMAITDITWFDGELFVAGVSNEEFASTLRRIPYPFNGKVSTSTIEIWHAVHAQFETRAPIITQLVQKIEDVPYLVAVYACTPIVRIPVADLKDGAHVRGEMIGELGFGNTPVDMVNYVDGFDGKEYVLVTHNSRSATRVAMADIPKVEPMPVNVGNNFGPAGINQYPIPVTASSQLDLIDAQWAVVIRRHPADDKRLDMHTLPLPFFFDRADHIVEMNWPGSPDPFGYKGGEKPQS
jgi:hypothetical protein